MDSNDKREAAVRLFEAEINYLLVCGWVRRIMPNGVVWQRSNPTYQNFNHEAALQYQKEVHGWPNGRE